MFGGFPGHWESAGVDYLLALEVEGGFRYPTPVLLYLTTLGVFSGVRIGSRGHRDSLSVIIMGGYITLQSMLTCIIDL